MGNAFGCQVGERKNEPQIQRVDILGDPMVKPLLRNTGVAPGPNKWPDLEVLLLEAEGVAEATGFVAEAEGASILVFKSHIGLALRCAFVCTMLAGSIIVPSWNNYLMAIQGVPAWMALVPGGVLLMVIFTVCGNLGGSLQCAWQGGAGTFIACLWAHIMSACMPLGAAGDHYDPYIMNLCNVTLLVSTYLLNISKNVRMFIVSYHVFFVMSLQNPATIPNLNSTWAINWDADTSTTMGTALMGLAGAIVVILVPKPLLAAEQARSTADQAVKKMCNMCDDLQDYYKGREASVRIAVLQTEAMKLQGTVGNMQGNIDAMWWESFDIGAAGRARALLGSHAHMMATLTANVFAMQICISKEDFGQSHVQCMQKINGQVAALLEASRVLLVKTTACIGDGMIDEKEAVELKSLIDKTNSSIVNLARSFNTTRKQMFPTQILNPELQAESFFVYCLSIHARKAVQYTQDMLDKPPKPVPLVKQIMDAGMAVFDASYIKGGFNKHSYAVRGTSEVLIAYYMGLYLFNYNAKAACVVSLLLAEFTGSAIVKNLGRLQAVVLAAVVPHVIMRIQGNACDPAITFLKAFSIFAWELLTNYIYFSSATYGYIGCLCAAFGLGILVYPCVDHQDAAAAAAAELAFSFSNYTAILQTTVAVLIMMIVDMVLSDGRASDHATKNLLRGLMSIDAWFQACLMQRMPDSEIKGRLESRVDFMRDTEYASQIEALFHGPRQPGQIMGLLTAAGNLGAEADKEPRYHRASWPTNFFDRILHLGHVLRANLNMVEQVLQGSKSECMYTDVFVSIRESKAWKDVEKDMVDTLGDSIFMVQEVLHNETAQSLPDVCDKAASMEGAESLEAMPRLFKTINTCGLKYPDNSTLFTLEEDVICRLNVILMLMEASVEDVAEMVKECLKMIKK